MSSCDAGNELISMSDVTEDNVFEQQHDKGYNLNEVESELSESIDDLNQSWDEMDYLPLESVDAG